MLMNSHYLKYLWFMSSDTEPVYFIFKKKMEENKWILRHWIFIYLINLGCYGWINTQLMYFRKKWHAKFIKFAVFCVQMLFPCSRVHIYFPLLHGRTNAMKSFGVLNGLLLIVLLYIFSDGILWLNLLTV